VERGIRVISHHVGKKTETCVDAISDLQRHKEEINRKRGVVSSPTAGSPGLSCHQKQDIIMKLGRKEEIATRGST